MCVPLLPPDHNRKIKYLSPCKFSAPPQSKIYIFILILWIKGLSQQIQTTSKLFTRALNSLPPLYSRTPANSPQGPPDSMPFLCRKPQTPDQDPSILLLLFLKRQANSPPRAPSILYLLFIERHKQTPHPGPLDSLPSFYRKTHVTCPLGFLDSLPSLYRNTHATSPPGPLDSLPSLYRKTNSLLEPLDALSSLYRKTQTPHQGTSIHCLLFTERHKLPTRAPPFTTFSL